MPAPITLTRVSPDVYVWPNRHTACIEVVSGRWAAFTSDGPRVWCSPRDPNFPSPTLAASALAARLPE